LLLLFGQLATLLAELIGSIDLLVRHIDAGALLTALSLVLTLRHDSIPFPRLVRAVRFPIMGRSEAVAKMRGGPDSGVETPMLWYARRYTHLTLPI
jgi:hypothetical protein